MGSNLWYTNFPLVDVFVFSYSPKKATKYPSLNASVVVNSNVVHVGLAAEMFSIGVGVLQAIDAVLSYLKEA